MKIAIQADDIFGGALYCSAKTTAAAASAVAQGFYVVHPIASV
jgi:hypothetical protein